MQKLGTAVVTDVMQQGQDKHVFVGLWAVDIYSAGCVPRRIEVYNSSFSDLALLSGKVPLTITDTEILIGNRRLARRHGELAVATDDAPEIIKDAVQAFDGPSNSDDVDHMRSEATARVARGQTQRTEKEVSVEKAQDAEPTGFCTVSNCNASSKAEESRPRLVFVSENGYGNKHLNKCLQQGASVAIVAATGGGLLVILEWPSE